MKLGCCGSWLCDVELGQTEKAEREGGRQQTADLVTLQDEDDGDDTCYGKCLRRAYLFFILFLWRSLFKCVSLPCRTHLSLDFFFNARLH